MKSNIKKLIALFCCIMMVLTSGIFPTGSGLKATSSDETAQNTVEESIDVNESGDASDDTQDQEKTDDSKSDTASSDEQQEDTSKPMDFNEEIKDDGSTISVQATTENSEKVSDAKLHVDVLGTSSDDFKSDIAALNDKYSKYEFSNNNTEILDINFKEEGQEVEPGCSTDVVIKIDNAEKWCRENLGMGEIKTDDLFVSHIKDSGSVENPDASVTLSGDTIVIKLTQDSFSGISLANIATASSSADSGSSAPNTTADTSDNLNDFLTDMEITGAEKNDDGSYTVSPNATYKITMTFEENPDGKQFDVNSMTYTLPDNSLLPVGTSGKFDMIIKVPTQGGGTREVSLQDNAYTVGDKTITVNWNTNGGDAYTAFKQAANAQFSLKFDAKFSSDFNDKQFGGDVKRTVTIDTSSKASISKTGTYDAVNNVINYTITVRGEKGTSTNLVVKDRLGENAILKLRKSSMQVNASSSDSHVSAVQWDSDGRGFSATIDQLAAGQTVTFHYAAGVNLSQIHNKGEQSETENDVTLQADNQPDQHVDTDMQGQIHYLDVNKSLIGQTQNGDIVTLKWQVDYAPKSQGVTAAGQTFRDKLCRTSGLDNWTYDTSQPLQMVITDMATGVSVTKTLSWEKDVTVHTSNANEDYYQYFDYKFPSNTPAGQKYQFIYSTKADTSKLVTKKSIRNHAGDLNGNSTDGYADVEPAGGTVGVKKSATAVSKDQIAWKISVTVPAKGLKSAKVYEFLPSCWIEEMHQTYYDALSGENGNLKDAVTIEGLQEGEDYTVKKESDGIYCIYFSSNYSDSDGNTYALEPAADQSKSRELVISLKTNVNQYWLNYAKKNNINYMKTHTNSARFCYGNEYQYIDAQDSATPLAASISKTVQNVEGGWGDSSKPSYISPEDSENKNAWIDTVVTADPGTDNLPIWKCQICVESNNLNQDLEINDIFDKSYFKICKLNQWDNLYVYGGDQYWPNGQQSASQVTVTPTDTGVKFTLAKKDLPSSHGYYYLKYYLQVKDVHALRELQKKASEDPDLKVTLTNQAEWNGSSASADFTYQENVLDKKVLNQGEKGADGNIYAAFQLTANPLGQDISDTNTITLKDTMSSNLVLDLNSIKYKSGNKELTNCSASYDDKTNQVVFTLPDQTPVTITYKARVIGSGTVTYSNTASLHGQTVKKESSATINTSGSGSASVYAMNIVKYRSGNINQRLSGAEFQLYKRGLFNILTPVKDKNGSQVTVTTDENGCASLYGSKNDDGWTLNAGTQYVLKETKAPEGYPQIDTDNQPQYDFTISDTENDPSKGVYINGSQITIANTPETTSVKVTKKWNGTPQAKAVVYVMNGDKEVASYVLTSEDNWTHTFTGLDKKDSNGKEITYTVKEDSIDGYTTAISKDTGDEKEHNFTITNTDNTKTSIQVDKKWVGKEGDSATFRVKKKGSDDVVAVATVTAKNNWTHTFSGLPKFDADGNEIHYTVTEDPIDGYTSDGGVKDEKNSNHYTFTNTKSVGSLKITKNVTVNGESASSDNTKADGTYQFEVRNSNGDAVTGSPFSITIKNGKSSTVTVDNLAQDTYTVSEVTSGLKTGISLTTDNDVKAQVEANKTADVSFTNDYSAEKTTVSFSGKKMLTGRTMKEGEFQFVLKNSDQKELQRVSNKADGGFTFADLTYDHAGTYTYTVSEDGTNENGLTYDNSVYTVMVKVTDDGKGHLQAEKTIQNNGQQVDQISFKNTYESKGSLVVKGYKTLTGRKLNDQDKFTFELQDAAGKKISETTNKGEDIQFAPITYSLDDLDKKDGVPVDTTKIYRIVESGSGNKDYIGYDHTVYTLKAVLHDNGQGRIEVTPAYYADDSRSGSQSFTFHNTYKATGSTTISGQKTLTGRKLQDNEFHFVLSGGNLQNKEEAANDADGKFSFGEIKYDQNDIGKTYTYTVKEEGNDTSYLTYDKSIYQVTVKITDNGKGNLTAEKKVTKFDNAKDTVGTSVSDGSIKFANSYKASGSTTISGTKTLNGMTPKKDAFKFILMNADRHTIDTAANDGKGDFSFKNITYHQSDIGKTYTYYVTEQNAGKKGYTYDSSVYQIKVRVTDKGNGELSAEKTVTKFDNAKDTAGTSISDGSIRFANTYKATGSTTISGTKTLNGKKLTDGEFTFQLTGDGIKGALEAANDANGNFTFEALSYTLADAGKTYHYQVREADSREAHISKDTSVYDVTVMVSEDNDSGDLQVTQKIKKNDQEVDQISFENTYETKGSLTIEGTKTLTGRNLKADEFTFQMTGDGLESALTVSNDGQGKYTFPEIRYTQKDLNKNNNAYEPTTKHYTVQEVQGTESGIAYDDTKYNIAVTLTDDGSGGINVKKTITKTVKKDGKDVTSNVNETDGIKFDNTYTASGSCTLTGNKKLTGRSLKADEFTFQMADMADHGQTLTAVNDADGTFTFKADYTLSDLQQAADGSYKETTKTYQISEINDQKNDIQYDDTIYTVKVTLKDLGDGTIQAIPKILKDGKESQLTFTNHYKASGELMLSGKKTLENKTLEAEEFSFELRGDGIDAQTVKNAADGSFSFAPISYSLNDLKDANGNLQETAQKTYTIKETRGSEAGIDYDQSVYTVHVTLTDMHNGTIQVDKSISRQDEKGETSTPDAITFTNTYSAKGSLKLSGKKFLENKALSGNDFTFVLADSKGNEIDTATNGADGKFSFQSIDYTLDDLKENGSIQDKVTKTYTVRESAENVKGITYDDAVYTVTATLQNAGNGEIEVTKSISKNKDGQTTEPGEITFDNQYNASGSTTISGTKTLNNEKPGEGRTFTFQLTGAGQKLTAESNQDGKFVFQTIDYSLSDLDKDKDGHYISTDKVYTVKEVKTGKENGITYDHTEYKVKVTLTDNGHGQINAVQSIEGGAKAITFNNTYEASGSTTISGIKTLAGRDLKAGDFSFTLSGGNLKEAVTKRNHQNGSFQFGKDDGLSYTLADAGKTYTYTLTENNEEKTGYSYDQSVYKIAVVVQDKGDGTLDVKKAITKFDDADAAQAENAKGTSVKEITFNNEYQANGSLTLSGTKTLNGRTQKAGEFTFDLKDQNGNVLQTATNTADGVFAFEPLHYKLAEDAGKTYQYTVSEEGTDGNGMTYDKTVYTITASVFDKGDGTLDVKKTITKKTDASAAEESADSISFTNHYSAEGTAEIGGTKKLSGRTLKDGEFSFELRESSGSVIETVSNDSDGNFSFKPLSYDGTDAGKDFHYIVDEVKGDTAGITYDSTVYQVTVHVGADQGTGELSTNVAYVSNDGTSAEKAAFSNTYDASGSLEINGTKKLTGASLKEGAFTFQLTGDGIEKPMEVKNKADGSFCFDSIHYSLQDAGKTYNYKVVEAEGNNSDVTYDSAVYKIKVEIGEDDGSGKLNITKTITKQDDTDDEKADSVDAITFVNHTRASALITGTKSLTGVSDLSAYAGEFRFDLLDESGNKIDTATNLADGSFTFAKLFYDKAGTYTYTVVEEHGGDTLNGIQYSGEKQTVTVDVTEGENGLTALVSGSPSFTNKLTRKLTVNKVWDDNDDAAGARPDSITVNLMRNGEKAGSAVLSAKNGWTHEFDGLDNEADYTVEELTSGMSDYYKSDIVYDGDTATITNTYEGLINITASKVLTGKTLESGEFTFKLVRNSDADSSNALYASNDENGNVIFQNVQKDKQGYTVTEVKGSESRVTYDTGKITYDENGNITSNKTKFTNSYKPMLLRVQKRSKVAPYDPLEGATYGLYQYVKGGNDILIESEVSDENGYMYYDKALEGVVYYFKEIAAPEGHEVDPYPGEKFMIKYVDGRPVTYDETGKKVISVGDITDQDSSKAYVQKKSTVSDLDSISYNKKTQTLYRTSSDGLTAAAIAANGALPEGTKLNVSRVTLGHTAQANLEENVGELKNVVYYNVSFTNANGEKVEPKAGSVKVVIQTEEGESLNGTDASNLKIVHLKKSDGTVIEPVTGSIAANGSRLYETAFSADSFSIFGVIEPENASAFGGNYMITAAGVSDQVSELNIAKIDTAGNLVKGAELQIKEYKTGRVVAEWTTGNSKKSFSRWFDRQKTESMNVDTYYVLHEKSAPDGYLKADDIMFIINKYDSSITVYKPDQKGNLVVDKEASQNWTNGNVLEMVDKPARNTVNEKQYRQKTIVHKTTVRKKAATKITRTTTAQAVPVKTGDNKPIVLLIAVIAVCTAAGVVLWRRKKLAEESQETSGHDAE